MVWMAGDPWEPVQRWVVFGLEPRTVSPQAWYWPELDRPSPRDAGHYDRVARRFVASPHQLFDLLTWTLYRETGCYARPFWIVQGRLGGHKVAYTTLEERYLRSRGLPDTPPNLGALDYAEPDERTFEAIGTQDRLRSAARGLNSLDKATQAKVARALNAQLLREVDDHVEAAYREVGPRNFDGVRRVDAEPAALGIGYERWRDRFIEEH